MSELIYVLNSLIKFISTMTTRMNELEYLAEHIKTYYELHNMERIIYLNE